MKKKVILVQPYLGKYDMFIRDLPLSLLYAGCLVDRSKYELKLFDQRVEPDFEEKLISELKTGEVLCVALTVMTGEPINFALETCRLVKETSNVPTVWGGIHPTILPEQTLENELVDIVVRGKGEFIFKELVETLDGQGDLSKVKGISYKTPENQIRHNEDSHAFDADSLPFPPYDLVDISSYKRSGFDFQVMSFITSRGCPHNCTFCYITSLSNKERRWQAEEVSKTVDHLEHVMKLYSPDYISIIDDDFFVNIKRGRAFFEEVERRNIKIKWGLRGVRIDEILRMDDSLLRLLERVGMEHMNIGVESGSPRMLEMIDKAIKIDEVLEANQKLAKYKKLEPLYNFFSGLPTETEEDLKCSTNLIGKLLKNNPQAQISGFHQFTPYPGNPLFDTAVEHGFDPPTNLETWAGFRLESNAENLPWIDKKRKNLLDMIYFTVYFVDRKYENFIMRENIFNRIVYPLVLLYKVLAKYRFKHHFTCFPLDIILKDSFYFATDFLKKLKYRKIPSFQIGSKT
ncbi:MAG: B12-binding domain-containing radical SAM protein [Nitrospinae bacterium]|nr:B12-binding domain-containing radical SAM protein [Nitrospinota bacterium]